ncbi:hypothetical protein DXG01_001002 [Tephrocybe rancida]|nr:hypothetical protein DXG01_001002 [Tephrocybe rancida]
MLVCKPVAVQVSGALPGDEIQMVTYYFVRSACPKVGSIKPTTMASLTERAKGRLATLSASFDDLEELLEPLFAQTLPETVLGLEPIQQAKLQTVLPYLVYDLVFIYLKTRGIDPKTHPVVAELERVKQYFNKISAAENPPLSMCPKHSRSKTDTYVPRVPERTEIDKGAAHRFIKHAIAQATYNKIPTEDAPGPSSTAQVQAKITSKMIERQLYEKKLKEQDARDGEEELEVFDDDMDVDPSATLEHMKNPKGKAKETPPPQNEATSRGNKRRRPALDPFAGYGDDVSPATASPSDTSTPDTQHSKKRAAGDLATDSAPGTPAPVPGGESSLGSSKKTKRSKKKSRKSLT